MQDGGAWEKKKKTIWCSHIYFPYSVVCVYAVISHILIVFIVSNAIRVQTEAFGFLGDIVYSTAKTEDVIHSQTTMIEIEAQRKMQRI